MRILLERKGALSDVLDAENWLINGMYLIGLMGLLWRRQVVYWLLVGGSVGVMAFLVGLYPIDPRLYLYLVPFAAIAVAQGFLLVVAGIDRAALLTRLATKRLSEQREAK